ncbi:glycoside hydrolase domain-containing protein, partial [Streptococcus pyogenes]
MGLYPLQVGSGELLVGVPALPHLFVRPTGSPGLSVERLGVPTARFIQSVRLDGKEWHLPTIPVALARESRHLAI